VSDDVECGVVGREEIMQAAEEQEPHCPHHEQCLDFALFQVVHRKWVKT